MLRWLLALLCCTALLACSAAPSRAPSDSTPAPAQAQAGTPPRFIHGALPVAPFVAEQLALAQGAPTVVYVGASWCEPCQRFHHALEAGELNETLRGIRFIDYDYDTAKAALDADGYSSQLIPLFVLPKADGRASELRIEGSIKGDGAVANILGRLSHVVPVHAP
jgi:thiol-disulfide isomerase/thioredoxin